MISILSECMSVRLSIRFCKKFYRIRQTDVLIVAASDYEAIAINKGRFRFKHFPNFY